MNNIQYYDIGLNLFCKQFPNPKEIVKRAAQAGVCCILTGTDRRENRLINEFVRKNDVFGTAGIHPHNADSARKEDFEEIERLIGENDRIVAVGEDGEQYSSRIFYVRGIEKATESDIVGSEKE